MSQISDPIGDFLIRLKNSVRAGQKTSVVPYSGIKCNIARILKSEGYIHDYYVDEVNAHSELRIDMKYINSVPAISGVKRISRPGLRVYVSTVDIPRVLGGMGTSIISTSSGVISGRQAKRINSGGELVAFVW